MGFITSDLARVPGKGYGWYIFALYDEWEDDVSRQLQKNLLRLAQEVGTDALVVHSGETSRFYDQVFYEYALKEKGFEHDNFPLPALLITDTPPTNIEEREDRIKTSRMILLPLAERYRRDGSITDILRQVVRVVKNDKEAFRSLQHPYESDVEAYWGWLPRYFELKPNFLGVGVNFNSMIEDLFKKNHK